MELGKIMYRIHKQHKEFRWMEIENYYKGDDAFFRYKQLIGSINLDTFKLWIEYEPSEKDCDVRIYTILGKQRREVIG